MMFSKVLLAFQSSHAIYEKKLLIYKFKNTSSNFFSITSAYILDPNGSPFDILSIKYQNENNNNGLNVDG